MRRPLALLAAGFAALLAGGVVPASAQWRTAPGTVCDGADCRPVDRQRGPRANNPPRDQRNNANRGGGQQYQPQYQPPYYPGPEFSCPPGGCPTTSQSDRQ